jgi:hypothetical protein
VIITAKPARTIDLDSFMDLTPVVVSSIDWVADGILSVVFATDLTPALVLAVQQRIESRNANEETLRNQAITAMQGNRDFLNIVGTPTNAQVLAQVKALSRQNNGVIRMLLGQLDGTD